MKFSTGFISSHSLLGWALLMGSANAGYEFYPENKEQLEAAALLLCNGTWPGPKTRYWEVKNITNFDRLFADSGNCNPDVEKWEVSQATSLEGMFAGATGFDHDLEKWDIALGADVSNFFADACPANSSAVIDPGLSNPAGVLFDPSRSAALDGLSPYIPVIDLGEMLERCACDGDLGFNKDFECVLCEDMNMRKGSKGVCVPICPPGAENYGDTCWCTSDEEEYEKYENTCVCKRGAYGSGNGTCVECPEHTDYKYKTYAGVGPVEDRCECSNYYEVWSSNRDKCICEEGAYGDGGDDCDKCPKDMEADSEGPGTGDKEDRCKCKREKYTTWDDDECVCKEGSYEYSKNKCYECKKNYGMEGKDGKGKGDGDIYERCQCISANAVLEDEECICKADSYGDGKYCTPCPVANGLEAFPNQGPGNGGLEKRCQCLVETEIIVDGECFEPCEVDEFGEAGGDCTPCGNEIGWVEKPDNEPGFGDRGDRCQCADGFDEDDGDCTAPSSF